MKKLAKIAADGSVTGIKELLKKSSGYPSGFGKEVSKLFKVLVDRKGIDTMFVDEVGHCFGKLASAAKLTVKGKKVMKLAKVKKVHQKKKVKQ